MSNDSKIFPAVFDNDKWHLAHNANLNVKASRLRFITFNTWFGDHYFKERLNAIVKILKETKADIIALQEITDRSLKIILEQKWIRENYFISDISGSTFYSYGVILLSRIPIQNMELHPLTSMMGRYVLTAEYKINGEKLLVGTTHLESLKHSETMRSVQLKEIFSLLKTSDHSILMGDLNFCSSWEENKNIDHRYSDLWQELQPNNPGYTEDTEINFMRKRLKREEKKVRFDRILLRSHKPGWRAKKINRIGMMPISAKHPTVFPSDHFGLFCSLDWCESEDLVKST